MSSKSSISLSYSKRNPQSQRPQRSPRRPRPHGHPQPTRCKPPTRPARYALDMGKYASLAITLQRHNIVPNAATLTKIGGDK